MIRKIAAAAVFILVLATVSMTAGAQETTEPDQDTLDSTHAIHADFKDLALETIDLLRGAEDELDSNDYLYKPAMAEADRSLNKLKRHVSTRGESDILAEVGLYAFSLRLDRLGRDAVCRECRDERDRAIRHTKDASVIKESAHKAD